MYSQRGNHLLDTDIFDIKSLPEISTSKNATSLKDFKHFVFYVKHSFLL